MKPIFGIVGQSGAGKTTLIVEMTQRFPDTIGIVKSLTTRPRRSSEDDLFYDFVTPDAMHSLEENKELVQVSEYAGNLYANSKKQLDELLSNKIGVTALVEDGVNNLRHAGYHVIVVKILPVHNPALNDDVRRHADARRAQVHLPADLIINNSFEPGGKQKAIDQLSQYIQSFAH